MMLKIKNLDVTIDKKSCLSNICLDIGPGEIHALMGSNGSGKSSLCNVILGHPLYHVNRGTILFNNQDITAIPSHERALTGIFLALQNPTALPGVNVTYFLITLINAQREFHKQEPLDAMDCTDIINQHVKTLHIQQDLLNRNVNEGFSGGEKKRLEILQMLCLNPKIILLDEIDSGLDIDAITDIVQVIKNLHNQGSSFLVISHYPKLLKLLAPSHVHLMNKGSIEQSGSDNLIRHIEQHGYR